jgi:phage shock protein E
LKSILSIFKLLFSGLRAGGKEQSLKHADLKKSEIKIIDVRTPQEFKFGHIEGAVLIPFDEIGNKIAKTVTDKNAPIALYCQSGSRSGAAYRTVESMGYTNAVNYGGISGAKRVLDAKN